MYFNAPRLQQRVPVKKNLLGEHAPKPPYQAHGCAAR